VRELKIDIFSDPACPWCLVGLHRLDKAIAELPSDVEAQIVHHPFLLDAATPKQGEDVFEMLMRKYGRDPSDMWDNLETAAKSSGLDVDMRKQKMRYPSQAALVLIMAARQYGTQHALARDLGRACYLDALNISDSTVLAEIASGHGFDFEEAKTLVTDANLQASIERTAADASRQGISGVPFFIFGGKFAFSGAQPEEVFAQAMMQALTADA
jgi:predicted DsbA family dithiol-disulfide isomerase